MIMESDSDDEHLSTILYYWSIISVYIKVEFITLVMECGDSLLYFHSHVVLLVK